MFYIDHEVLDSPLIKRIKSILPVEKTKVVSKIPFSDSKGDLSKSEFDRSKKNIFFTKFKGSFFKRCPGARPGLSCCNYFVLNLGLQCDMNCSYCYLQSFINTPLMTVYTNIDEAIEELENLKLIHEKDNFRIGTGEVIDSLSLDDLTLYSRQLIDFFKTVPNWKLELKTKSSKVDHFLNLGPAKNVIASWSVNPQYIIESEEHGTASLKNRLLAAKKCLDSGFSLSFHIDPMIWHPEWKKNYSQLVNEITQVFSPSDVLVLSVGALRFQPEQKAIMRERFGFKSWVTRAEVFPSSDGKLRYDKKLRLEMFDYIVKEFKDKNPLWNIFFCMETPETWLKSTFKSLPKSVHGLKELFDHKIIKNTENRLSLRN